MHKKGKEKSNRDGLSRSAHMTEALLLEDDEFAEFYKVDELVIRFEGGVNKIQHSNSNNPTIQQRMRFGVK